MADPPNPEILRILHVDPDGAIVGVTEHSDDRTTDVALPIRRIVADALACNATSWVVSHTHPGGDPRPSRADIRATRMLAQAGAAIGIRLHDHVVEGGDRHFSFREAGLI